MRFGSLFSGIGGIDLGLERAGMECAWQVEIDEFCRKVLTKHWPNVPKYNDVRECGKHNLERVDLVAGGFPCQPFSSAGRRNGATDDRHLWPQMARIVSELRPAWVLAENVAGVISMVLDDVLSDLEGQGYAAQAFVIPACAKNAPHGRDRVWIVAHSNAVRCDVRGFEGEGIQRQNQTRKEVNPSDQPTANPNGSRSRTRPRLSTSKRQGLSDTNGRGWGSANARWSIRNASVKGFPDWAGGEMGQPPPLTEFERPNGREVERNFRGVVYGVSRRVDRLRALGNAVVPQVVEEIGRRILEAA